MHDLPRIIAADFGISGFQWVIILVVALLLFGHRLPAMMRGLGGSLREFRKGVQEEAPPSAAGAATPPSAPATAPAPPASGQAAPAGGAADARA